MTNRADLDQIRNYNAFLYWFKDHYGNIHVEATKASNSKQRKLENECVKQCVSNHMPDCKRDR